mmetsp:Transcript_12340/g.31308  ORF Transcript_12340/g.31308 Transcript_12340/m.31308 type:complete len:208 (-) Transcript_12340:2407-3030(-)
MLRSVHWNPEILSDLDLFSDHLQFFLDTLRVCQMKLEKQLQRVRILCDRAVAVRKKRDSMFFRCCCQFGMCASRKVFECVIHTTGRTVIDKGGFLFDFGFEFMKRRTSVTRLSSNALFDAFTVRLCRAQFFLHGTELALEFFTFSGESSHLTLGCVQYLAILLEGLRGLVDYPVLLLAESGDALLRDLSEIAHMIQQHVSRGVRQQS